MKNLIKWTNLSQMPFTVNVYRGDAPLDRANLGTPLATLTNGESQYEDDVPRGSTKYYVLETVKGTDKASTNNIQVLALPRRGPGPIQLLQGDYNYGYFGTVASRDFLGTQELVDKVAPFLAANTFHQQAPVWHKYIRKGKVIYVPNGALVAAVSYTSLYNGGLVFGVNGPGPYKPGAVADVNQLKTFELNGNQFKVRLMTGYNDDLTAVIPPGLNTAEDTNPLPNEWDDFVYPMAEWVPVAQRMANVQQNTYIQLKFNVASYRMLCQELYTGIPITRGANANSRASVATRGVDGNVSVTAAGWCSWWPVIELL
jgi:hypothetical protein